MTTLASPSRSQPMAAPWRSVRPQRRQWNHSGHVRVYQYINSSWVQLGTDIDGEAEYDKSGYSVSLSADGSTVAIGAPTTTAMELNLVTCASTNISTQAGCS